MQDPIQESTLSEITLRDFYYTIFRHKWKVLLIFIVFSLAGLGYVLITPDMYVSTASLLIRAGRESVEMIPTTDSNRAISVTRTAQQDINNEIEILKSREVYEELVNRIGIKEFLKFTPGLYESLDSTGIAIAREDILTRIQDYITITNKSNSNIISISYASPSPEIAYTVISNILDIFQKRHLEIHYSASSFEFFDEQTRKTLESLNNVEKRLAELENGLNISSIDEYRASLLDRIRTLQTERDNISTSIAQAQSMVVSMQQQLDNLPETIELERVTGTQNTLQELYSLQLREQELLSNYTEDNIQVIEIRRQIAEAKRLLSDESQVNRGVNSTYQDLHRQVIEQQVSLGSLQAKLHELDRLLTETRTELSQLNVSGIEIQDLERQRALLLENYQKYADSLEEARIDQIVQQQQLSNIRIMQPATYPQRPLTSRKYRNLGLGIFIGLFGGIGFAVMAEYFDHTIRKKEDIEKWLRTRMLVAIPSHSNK